jgi:hypothetical protein
MIGENMFLVTLWTVCPNLEPYVCYDILNRMSSHKTVCPLRGFQGESHFLSTSPPILRFLELLKAS